MMHGRNNRKKLMAVRIVKHAMEIIFLLTDQNPIQVIIDAVINSGPRKDATYIGSASVVRPWAGKSIPHACLEENATWDLIDDIEKLREHLEIPEWQVFGGLWGSTLALAYSESYLEKVTGLVLRGIFLLRKKEIDWFYESGAAAIYPNA
ncbi:hypothetical protein REPUB_Repub05bG0095900 [Reevesia pubescens]